MALSVRTLQQAAWKRYGPPVPCGALPQRCSAVQAAHGTTLLRKSLCAAPTPSRVTPTAGRQRCVTVKAAAASAGGDEVAHDKGLGQTLLLGGLFAAWYAANIYFNIYNKQVLKAFPYPLTCTTVQFAIGSLITVVCWATGVVRTPHVTPATLARIAPLAFCHTLGNLLTNMSLGAVAVSFTHTIKASEPFFSVLLSSLVLGDTPNPIVLATLLPIVGGVAIASLTEASFNWLGFLTAMGSNLTFQSRNVLSKKLMNQANKQDSSSASSGGSSSGGSIDKANLFGLMTILSFFMLLPVGLLVEGWNLAPGPLRAMGVSDPMTVMQRALSAALTFHLYQQVSYLILERVSPVTHSIGNCVKRVIVIVASVLFFQNPMSMQNAIGTGIALAGVFAYSQAKRFKGKPTVKAAAAE